jgi:uncharacterized protein YecT (DUF1311 family)
MGTRSLLTLILRSSAAILITTAVAQGTGRAAWAADPTVDCDPAVPSAENPAVVRQVYAQALRDGASPRVLLATFQAAWVESHFNNCSDGDADSVGVFQQRASWGSVAARTTVATATHEFVRRANNVDAVSAPSVTAGQIAQKVQASAHPLRYDQEQAAAAALQRAYSVVTGAGTRMVGTGAYLDVSSTGQVYAWNGRYLGGSPGGYSGRFTDAKVTVGGNGYRLLTSAGQIYAYGDASYAGGGAAGHTGDMIALAATPDGQGYAMLSATGQVYAYGTASYYGGSPAGASGEFVDLEMTPSGRGYWLLTSAGQIYAYGDAGYHGGTPAGFSRAMVAMSPTPTGRGYVLVSKSGQVYAYGDARYLGGSPGGISGGITDISHAPGAGYLLISGSGQHYAYGSSPFLGNPAGASPF